MNKQQQTYLKTRLDTIARDKRNNVYKIYGMGARGETLSEFIKKSYSEYSWLITEFESHTRTIESNRTIALKAIEQQVNELMDTLVFENSADIVAMLKSFEESDIK